MGQYRFPIVRYWRALIVMFVGYEVQFQMFKLFASLHGRDNLDTATSYVLSLLDVLCSFAPFTHYSFFILVAM